MKDLTLVIMAAGMGSRFGGLKQIEPVGPNGEFIIDYSIYDAIKVGVSKIVFIIKEENYDLFRDTVGKRVEKQIEVEYAFQKQDNIPDGVTIPEDRVKPWGTGHAILSAKDKVKGNFIVINADDFYGRDAYEKARDFFANTNSEERTYGVIGYQIKNTLTENGAVKRGVCAEEKGYLTQIIESSVERKENTIVATPLDGSESFEIEENCPVSMNMFCFTKDIMDYLDEDIVKFFDKNKENLSKCEYLIPDVVYENVKKNIAKVKVVPTTAVWQGITYKEDKQQLVDAIAKLVEENEYPKNLWN